MPRPRPHGAAVTFVTGTVGRETAERAAHVHQLRKEIAAHQVAAAYEANLLLRDFAAWHGRARFAPARLAENPRDRAWWEEAHTTCLKIALDKRVPQLTHLRRELARVTGEEGASP